MPIQRVTDDFMYKEMGLNSELVPLMFKLNASVAV